MSRAFFLMIPGEHILSVTRFAMPLMSVYSLLCRIKELAQQNFFASTTLLMSIAVVFIFSNPSFVKAHMFGLTHDSEVFNSVVASYVIDMMDNLLIAEGPTEMLLHDKAMLGHPPPVYFNSSIVFTRRPRDNRNVTPWVSMESPPPPVRMTKPARNQPSSASFNRTFFHSRLCSMKFGQV
jgi:hypothetical protein